MIENQPSIDQEATEAVFGKYGGVSGWLMESSLRYETPEQEQASYMAICKTILMYNDERRIMLDSERSDAFVAAEDGLMFGLYVLTYNFMVLRDDLTQEQIDFTINHYGEQAQKYIDGKKKFIEPNDESDFHSQQAAVLEGEDVIPGLRTILESSIDQLCPDIERQVDFRQGVSTAEAIFVTCFEFTRLFKQRQIKEQFEEMMADSGIKFEI